MRATLSNLVPVLSACAWLSLSGCGSDAGKKEQKPAGCEPDSVQICSCEDGRPGQKTCSADRVFGDCRCTGEFGRPGSTGSGNDKPGGGGDGTDGTDGTLPMDAGPGGPPNDGGPNNNGPDGAPPGGNDPATPGDDRANSVTCGGSSCDLNKGNECCVDEDAGVGCSASGCVGAGIYCDGPEDCDVGDVCCLENAFPVSAYCSSGCGQGTVCHTNDDCSGNKCTAVPFADALGICQF